MAIEFLYFDLGNVLLTFSHQRACDQMAEVAGVPAARVSEVVFDSGLNARYERGEISTDQFHEEFNRLARANAPRAELINAWNDIFELQSSTISIVRNLHRAGHRLGILSNTCHAHWEYVMEKYPVLCVFFSAAVTSFEAQAMKPEAKIYQHAMSLANVLPEEIFFVDDRAENVHGANQCGWQATQFTTAVQLADDLNRLGVNLVR